MALTLPYTTIDQFAADTVHSYTAHNTPHNRLIANDIAIAAAINTLQSTSSIGYKSAYTAGPLTLPASYTDFVSASITKAAASSILVVFGKYTPFINQESFLYAGAMGIIAKNGVTISNSETEFYHYSGGATNSYGCLIPFALITDAAAGANTISLQVKYVAGSYTANLKAYSGSLIIFEIPAPAAL